ncbi:MAG TPA: ABC transporter permease [Gemmatimonadaceae bacterium]|nr:ABC transporter permease [Gemmatimonadaceae bacterium]
MSFLLSHRPVWIDDIVKDVRFALRIFGRAPVFTGAAVLTIALGIGANTAIFSAVNAVVLRPLPFPHPERLYLLAEENAPRGWHQQMVSTANYLDWRDGVSAFEGLAAYEYSASTVTLSGMGDSRRTRVVFVTGNLFATLGVRAQIGRTLEDGETWSSTPATLVLSDAMWTREFGRDPSVIGRTITLDGNATQIVGVMPPAFAFPYDNVDGWLSFRWDAGVRSKELWRRERWLRVVGRLAPNASLEAATAQLATVSARLARDYPLTNANTGASIVSLHRYLVGDTRTPLFVLLGAVAMLLVIACVNVANLLLVQAAGRQRELALRLALGAARGRLIRQVITESLLLSVMGSAGGLALGIAGTRAFVALQPAGLLRVQSFGVDATVMIFVALISTATGVLFGLGPALWIRRRDPGDVLKQDARTGTQSGAMRQWADMLAAAEVALALLMTTGAALLVGSARRLANVDPGFDARGVLMTGYELYSHAYDSAQYRDAFHNELLARARRIPGVTHVAFGSTPLEPNLWRSGVVVRGRPALPSIEAPHMYGSPDWLATLGIPLRRGRFFTSDDRRDPSRIVVNETFARMFFPGEDAVGQQVSFTKEKYGQTTFTIIGVIADVHETALLAPPGPLVIDQFLGFSGPRLLIRTKGDPNAVVAPLRSILREMDPALALTSERPLTVLRDQEMARSRFFAAVLLAFAVVGLVLAAIGIYGVLSHIARSRSREMSIRIALGADPSHVRWLVVRHGAAITAAGLLVGMVVSLASTRVLSALLFDLSPNDPVILGGVILVLAAASGLASFIPASRAGRADAMDALRAD